MAISPYPKETQYLFKKDDLLFVLSLGWGGWDAETGQEGLEEKNTLDEIFRSFQFIN